MYLKYKPSLLKTPRLTRKVLLPPKRATAVLVDYITAYSTFICQPDMVKTCVDTMILPAPHEQLRILQGLEMIGNTIDLEGLEGVVMKLLMIRDTELLDSLVHTLSIYQQSRDVINSIIRYSYEISTGLNIGLEG